MEADEEFLSSEPKEVENEAPVVPAPAEVAEIKIPRAKIRVTSIDRTPSPNKKIWMRQSIEGPVSKPQTHFDDKRRDSKLLDVGPNLSPTVKLTRVSTSSSPLTNGLDPMGMELISGVPLAMNSSDYSDKSEEIFGSPKMNREMKNLQTSTNSSKILSDYLNTSNEGNRSRSRKTKETPAEEAVEIEEETEELEETADIEMDEDMDDDQNDSVKEDIESDTTMILPMEPPDKRRKSIYRSRVQARAISTAKGRKKSIKRQLNDEMSVASDKEETPGDDDEDDQMSEVSFITNRSLDGRAVNPPPKPGWDSFCFKCHTDTAVLSLACSKCKCSYHRHCVRPNPIPKNVDEFECPECREIETALIAEGNKYGHDKIDPNTLAEMLTIILEKIRTYPDREAFENDIVLKVAKEPTQPLIVTQMSLKILETRIKNRHYKVTEAFIHDIKQLEHNWNVVDRAKSKTLKSIVKYVNTEINELEACVYCYEKSFISGDWFVNPCERPHLLIWAKLKGYPYWPAKVMSIDARQQVDVRFFGAHDRAWVPAAHCMLFSEKDPNKTKGSTPTNNKNASKTQKGIADAMKEKDDYIENLRKKFGFKYAAFRQQLDPNHLQSQLEFMLPGLKGMKNGGVVEAEVGQKEKLTLKIIKGSQSNYQVEQKSAEIKTPTVQKQSEKDRPKLYKVMSNENTDQEPTGKLSLIIKRKSNVEQETEKAKKAKPNDTASETSESNASVQSGKGYRKKTARVPPKHRKSVPELAVRKGKHAGKNPPTEVLGPTVDEPQRIKAIKRARTKSVLPESDKPLLVPAGTDEIQPLRNDSPMAVKRTKSRSQSYQRSRSVEKESVKEVKLTRRLSVSSPPKRSLSENKDVSRRNSVHENATDTKEKQEDAFDPHLVIKNEPVSDGEEVVQRDELTLSDIPNLIQDNSGKRKVIVISTTDRNANSNFAASLQNGGRARKTFPNQPNPRQSAALALQQLQNRRDGDWMVCIPQAVDFQQTNSTQSPPTSNRSTPASESQVSISQVRSNPSSSRGTPNLLPAVSISSAASSGSNRSTNQNVPPLNFLPMAGPSSVQQRDSMQTNPIYMNGQRISASGSQRSSNMPHDGPPRLVPRPQGVFVSDGTTFNRDMGPVSRMFTDNAHRMSDYFRGLLIDTVCSFAPELPIAENLMLRAEIEKLHKEMQTTKSDCQHKMQELRREHQDEIESVKKANDEIIASLKLAFEQEKARLVNEIRQQSELEKQRAIDITRKETKKTTWCSNCTREARFYCCWNTSYCGPPCQKTHWAIHQKYCTNKNSAVETPPPAQQVNKQTNTDIPVVIQGPNIMNRQAIVLRSPQQLQQILPAPPMPVQQHYLLPAGATSAAGTVVTMNQSLILAPHQKHVMRVISEGQIERIREPPNATKTLNRHDQSINLITKDPMTDSMLIRVTNPSSTPTSMSPE